MEGEGSPSHFSSLFPLWAHFRAKCSKSGPECPKSVPGVLPERAFGSTFPHSLHGFWPVRPASPASQPSVPLGIRGVSLMHTGRSRVPVCRWLGALGPWAFNNYSIPPLFYIDLPGPGPGKARNLIIIKFPGALGPRNLIIIKFHRYLT